MSTKEDIGKALRSARWLGSVGLILLFAVAGCAGKKPNFKPTAIGSASTEGSSAYYNLSLNRQNIGEVKVFTRGIHTAEQEDYEKAVEIGLRLRNDTDSEMTLERSALDMEVQTKSGVIRLAGGRPMVRGDTVVPAGGISRLQVAFPLPDGIKVKDIASFEILWRLQTGEGVLGRSTKFVRQEDPKQTRYVFVDSLYPRPLGWGYPYGYPF